LGATFCCKKNFFFLLSPINFFRRALRGAIAPSNPPLTLSCLGYSKRLRNGISLGVSLIITPDGWVVLNFVIYYLWWEGVIQGFVI
jgi:hypothetical protein